MLELQHMLFSDGPRPVAPFSHAVRAGDFLFVTGQMPTVGNDNSTLVSGDVEAQMHQVMSNLKDILAAAGLGLERVVSARLYLVNFGDYARVNRVYESYFEPGKLPCRTCIGVTGLAVGASVEMDLIAAY